MACDPLSNSHTGKVMNVERKRVGCVLSTAKFSVLDLI